MHISDEHFSKFNELMKEEVGEEKYNKMTEQELFESATKLVTLVETVYKYQNRDNYEKEEIKTEI